MLDDVQLTSTEASIIRDIQSSDFARIVLLVLNDASVTGSKTSSSRTLGVLLRHALSRRDLALSVYCALDKRRVHLKYDPFATEDCAALLDGIERLTTTLRDEDSAERFPKEITERIREAKLDVVVKFGFVGLRGAVPDIARHGTWAFRYGDHDGGGPACFQEMVEGEPVTTVAFLRLPTGLDPGLALAKAVFATDPGSLAKNRAQAYFGSTHLVVQKLRELHSWGWKRVEQRSQPDSPVLEPSLLKRYPANVEVIRWVAPLLARKALGRVRRLVGLSDRIDHWRIATRRDRERSVVTAPEDMSGFRWIESPKGHFYADPFVLERDGRSWMFFEDLTYSVNRGVIACTQLSDDGRMADPRVVLASDGHLSYPCVFVDGATVYMIPEAYSERVVRLYRATSFPDVWEQCADLYEGASLDTTVWRQDGLWWFFTTLREPRGGAMMLMLLYADSLTGTWMSHPMNPISIDVHNVRGAGAIFRENGRLMRPSQDCSGAYGYSFTFNEIVTLSTTDYAERARRTVEPDWDRELVGTHTYGRVGSVEVIDGKVRRFRSDVN